MKCIDLLIFIHEESTGTSSLFNDYSKFGYVSRKFDALGKFFEFKVESDKLLGKHFKILWLDRDGMSSKFNSFLKEHSLYPNCVH